ncbi:US12 family protein [Solirubrobacter sp. CPCC 204708]|uniref:Bax inhibitor-1 family protein n=1 Tax=Solirubrobacter deserti TaxID=2282478 RepID=A0ABT4RH72_9ACTN|nr:Bax inhibitor-1 family protein [Solirubrobacter deserti]MBE2315196.1 US12 family protein [Solirubrobacter deserti]MDA0137879.1 Bax inhibitor-1 family protein [Solirubrobacter deserti]
MSFIEVSSGVRERDTSLIMGQVLSLVAAAIGLAALCTYLGRDLAPETARIFSIAGMVMLVATWFVARLRFGALGIFWLMLIASAIGYGLGPVLDFYVSTNPSSVTSAAGLTALTVLGMGAIGFVMSKDTVRWMRPLSFVVLGAVVVSLGALIFGGLGTLSPFLSIIILAASALLILVDFNYVRKHATEDDVVWLATGIFVSIINIFLSLLNLFNR